MKHDSDVKIVELPQMRVAACRATGKHPEIDAFKTLVAWAEKSGVPHGDGARFFGFDNPRPSPDAAEYGYEIWLAVGPDVEASNGIVIREIPGGKYAVSRTVLSTIGQSWKDIVAWREARGYRESPRQCLEEHLELPIDISHDAVTIDLYLPIEQGPVR